ncbi:hypothetical protein GCG54_00014856 [Colletotrichum gloeosporioides]|uniref:Nuclear membrane fusion protein Kar5 n=1 Tax=Colletotrichum gloeosporioides TaxID=474922 RepID=A0A8H4CCY6_COLGL|nr:uncharacterized protein GCG54_00014856 [Colletotrichum gloeosporioides]KAF3801640.1 hypothetical protein GCG54_00014856 [Colletotrichum gloeosporioides]
MWCNTSQLLYGAALILSSATSIHAFSWYGGERNSDHGQKLDRVSMGYTIGIQPASRLPNIYAVAMQELQELESEPLCHRIAARLLVNNCQLLDGKDDATVLIDSGRQIRDFVDSYAASLAICDLERGSFDIPSGCAPFRESFLAQIPDSKFPRLHVSPQQIDSCLSGLARSDSAWNTWVSYRHKALRFCEAARTDNDKAQSIRLHQRLTEVLSKLSEGVEQELEAHLHAINTRATEVTDQLRRIIPDIDQLRDNIKDMDRTLSQQMMETAQASQYAMRNGLEDAQNLQQLLGVLLRTVLSSNAEVAASHEVAITAFKDRTESDLSVVMAALASAAVSSASLQSQMELSHLRVAELAGRQQNLEKGLGRLFELTEDLSSHYEVHSEHLTDAQKKSEDILVTLDKMANSASDISGSFKGPSGWIKWVPYLICPTGTLLMGSYGLPPSAGRNLVLIGIGEVVGAVISHIEYLKFAPHTWQTTTSEPSSHGQSNHTLQVIPADHDVPRRFSSDLRKTRRGG